PLSAIYTSPKMREYREWLTTSNSAARMSLGGSFYSKNIEDYYATPWDLGYGHIIKFDHDFVGREALERNVDKPHRRKVTLVWHPDDFVNVFRKLVERGTTAMHIDLPVSATSRLHYVTVIDTHGKVIGFGHYH